MRNLEHAVAEVLREDAHDYDPAARDRVLETLARTTAAGTPSTRRRLWLSMGAVAVLTAAAVLTGTLAQHFGGGQDQKSDKPTVMTDLDVPPGKRLVGLGQVVVAVPASWVNWQPSCGEADSGYVYFEPVAAIRCYLILNQDKVVSSLGIASTGTASAREVLRGMSRTRVIDGMLVSEDFPDCPNTLGGTCTQHFAVPTAGVLFTVRFLNTSGVLTTTFTDIRDSLMLLPDDVTTVPHQDDHIAGSTGGRAADLMRSGGLDVSIEEEPHRLGVPGDVLLSIDPPPGSPIHVGDTVRLTVSSWSEAVPDSAPTRPQPITMHTVRRIGIAQQFRAYTGPTPPAFSEAEALSHVQGTDGYSLGLWDVGLVHEDTSVTWTPVWIMASEYLVDDLNQLSLGGRIRGSDATDPSPARPGWVRDVVMYDAKTGADVLGYTF